MIGIIPLNGQTIFLKYVLYIINTLFLGWIPQPAIQPKTYTDFSQSDCSKMQRGHVSRYPGLLLDYFLAKIIGTLLPRLPTGNELLTTSHDSFCSVAAISSVVYDRTIRSSSLTNRVPGFLSKLIHIIN